MPQALGHGGPAAQAADGAALAAGEQVAAEQQRGGEGEPDHGVAGGAGAQLDGAERGRGMLAMPSWRPRPSTLPKT